MRSFDIDQYIINVQYNGRNMNNESGFVIGRDIILINLRRKSPKECNFFFNIDFITSKKLFAGVNSINIDRFS